MGESGGGLDRLETSRDSRFVVGPMDRPWSCKAFIRSAIEPPNDLLTDSSLVSAIFLNTRISIGRQKLFEVGHVRLLRCCKCLEPLLYALSSRGEITASSLTQYFT